MPKISAPTVAEHRARQRAALLDAARTILFADGAAAVTPAAVGQRAGLARSSVYEYFGSAGALLAELATEAFASWSGTVRAAVARAGSPRARVDAYVTATLRLVGDGEHRIADALATAPLPEASRRQFVRLHDELTRPLADALHDLGVAEPALRVVLLQAMLDAATRQINAGADVETVTSVVLAFARGGLR